MLTGALAALVDGMRAYIASEEVQDNGAYAIGHICAGSDEGAPARKQAASRAGAADALKAAAEQHKTSKGVQQTVRNALEELGVSVPAAMAKREAHAAACEEYLD